MAAVIAGLAPTTELEAVNTMLAALGEEPLPNGFDLSAATGADVRMAIVLLRRTAGDVLGEKWRFNSEFGYSVSPSSTSSYTDTDGTAFVLNIFKAPAGLLSFAITPIRQQRGLDVTVKKSGSDFVFYDRGYARNGFVQADFPYLYINPVWYVSFEDMPDTARKYIAIRAARIFAQSAVGSPTLVQFTQQDEQMARRALVRDQGLNDRVIFMNSNELAEARGLRHGFDRQNVDTRRNPGH